jgi:signal transduction histidine kinase
MRPETEVIMITGHGDLELAIQSLKHQAADFIIKPIHDELLEVALRRAEERIAMRRQLRHYTENLEQLVAEKSRRLMEAERMATIGETIAGLAHTIKNIAGALKGGVFVLEKGLELNDRTYLQQGWEMIKGNLDTIGALSMDLLDFGKLTRLHLQSCDPNQPAEQAYALLHVNARQRGVELCWNPATGLAPVRLDPEAITRCLVNVVSNAVDACLGLEPPREASRVCLSLEREDSGGVRYTIQDNGCGMDSDTLAQLFHPFFSTKGNRGTGIGLMMSRRIVQGHHGTIEVDSLSGQGTTFRIHLPADPDAAAESGGPTGPQPSPAVGDMARLH